MRFRLLGLAVALGLLAPHAVSASISFSYVTGASSYTGTPGTPITVPVYLQEVVTSSTTGGGNVPLEIAPPTPTGVTGGGITSMGIYVSQTGAASNPSTLVSFTPLTTFTSLTFTGNLTGNQLDFGGNEANGATPVALTFVAGTGTAGGPGTYQALVGNLSINPTSTTTTFGLTSTNNPNLLDPSTTSGPGGNDSTFDYLNGFDLDSGGTQLNASNVATNIGTGTNSFITSFTVGPAAVPEPSSMILTGLVGSVIGLGIWLRRRTAAVAASAAG